MICVRNLSTWLNESQLIDSFEGKTRSPDWNVVQMSLDDLKLALQIFDVGCVSQLIAQGVCNVDGIYILIYCMEFMF
jgi:hypothetical protein